MKYILILFSLFAALNGFSQQKDSLISPKLSFVKIKTSAVCDMCKETIEKAMAFEKGLKKSNLDVDSKMLSVWFNPKKTNSQDIRISVTKIGYDADNLPAQNKAYQKLNECCKKDAHK
jgi:periplasmic mercuric ion binding protein